MAGVRTYKRYYPGMSRKRRVRKQNARTARTYVRKRNVVNRSLAPIGRGFPKKLMITHKYVDYATITGTAGAMVNYIYSCNGLHDPNITGGGHQPLYYDQLSAIYDHYTVVGSKFTVRIMPASANTTTGNLGVWIDDNAVVTGATAESVAEQSSAKLRMLPLSAASAGPVVVTQKWSAKKWFGGSVLANNSLQGSGANPSEQSYFIVSLQSHDQTTTIVGYIVVEIQYIAIWAELKDIATS